MLSCKIKWCTHKSPFLFLSLSPPPSPLSHTPPCCLYTPKNCTNIGYVLYVPTCCTMYCSRSSQTFKSLPGAESVIGRWRVGTHLFPPAMCSLAVDKACKCVCTSAHYQRVRCFREFLADFFLFYSHGQLCTHIHLHVLAYTLFTFYTHILTTFYTHSTDTLKIVNHHLCNR